MSALESYCNSSTSAALQVIATLITWREEVFLLLVVLESLNSHPAPYTAADPRASGIGTERVLRVTSTRIASRNLLDRTCPDVSGDISGGLESCNWTAKNDVGRSLKYDACMHVRTYARTHALQSSR